MISRYLPMFFYLLLAVFFCTDGVVNGQSTLGKPYPQNYFRNPMSIAPSLAGNFGALRANHYHMGLDFRTGGRENISVVAAADGYVSHIRVEPYGYGRAIFITHPNGYTTLYAHLNSFFPNLEQYVVAQQYALQSWQQDIDFVPNQFPVKKGQFIALSGNTGGSEGPHLHFEIRDSGLENGHNHNPLLFNMGIADHIPPVLYTLGIFNRNQSIYENSPQRLPLQKRSAGGKTYYAPVAAIIKVPYGKFSLGLQMEDKVDNSFLFGIYSASLYVDSELKCSFAVNECVYEDSRYINAGIDYFTRYNGGGYMQHLSVLPGNHLPYYTAGHGVIELLDDSVHTAEVEVKDVAGNISFLRVSMQRSATMAFPANFNEGYVQKLVPGYTEIFEKNDLQVVLDENALYDTCLLRFRELPTVTTTISKLYSIGDYRIPLHDSMMVKIQAKQEHRNMLDSVKRKVIMVMRSGKKTDAQPCRWNGNWAEARWWNFGDFYLKYDEQKPVLKPVNVYDSAVFTKDQKLVFDAYDETGDLQLFTGMIDGWWVPFQQKKNRYSYSFDDHCQPGWHTLLVKAKDLAGNETVYQCSFLNGAK